MDWSLILFFVGGAILVAMFLVFALLSLVFLEAIFGDRHTDYDGIMNFDDEDF